MGLDVAVQQVPDATTLLHFRHLQEAHQLGERLFAEQNRIFEAQGRIMRGGSIVDATIIAAPSSTRNATGTRDPAVRQTKKGNQWYVGLKGPHRCRRRHRVRALGHSHQRARARLGRGDPPGA
jgi:IS5 family transposase